jgi:diaminohydroxyphosphoribosylaminopyrimidine deaminase/5-amino-6-(5-phosphoribosylamino)uracil reductase
MNRCLVLAALGAGQVAPNPMVGAVLVYEHRIIGEGCHEQFGGAHAEVNCNKNVSERSLIGKSTLYVSLEPCAHFGKTPPCADLIIEHKIPAVVIGCRDSFDAVNGRGIEKLKAAGINVTVGILEKACRDLNRRFFTFHEKKRPYVILKWAQTKDGIIGSGNTERLLISNDTSNKLVHKWRSEEAAILVGTRTARQDDPALTTRFWPGKDPLRVVIDKELKLPAHLRLFDGAASTIIFNHVKDEDSGKLRYIKLDREEALLPQLLNRLYQLNVQSVMVEGGSALLDSFIREAVWDEARVITNNGLTTGSGVEAPLLHNAVEVSRQQVRNDTITFYRNTQ